MEIGRKKGGGEEILYNELGKPKDVNVSYLISTHKEELQMLPRWLQYINFREDFLLI